MKIGILTLPLHTNYGGILQAYALQTVLTRMGHEVIVLNRDRDIHRSRIRKILSFTKYIIKNLFCGENFSFLSDQKINSERREREKLIDGFIKQYIHERTVQTITCGILNDMDAVIVGSDQIWRSVYFKNLWGASLENAFLKFQENVDLKRIAYAASFGTEEWEYNANETKKCARLLNLFDAVSVRESSGVELCKTYLGRNDVQHVLDPTLLLTKDDYLKILKTGHTQRCAGELMCYILNETEDNLQLVNRIAKEYSLTPFYTNPERERIHPSIEQWVRGFLDAEFVVTDSFHACVFCIIFETPFVVIGNKDRGMARFESLLSMFHLEQNFIYESKEYNSSLTYEVSIESKKLLESYRIDSCEFLKNALL